MTHDDVPPGGAVMALGDETLAGLRKREKRAVVGWEIWGWGGDDVMRWWE
ncbi:hypothetical protein C882_0051 [Caenispirillum salinarum AK4]|uniref:Uncharacterized protein n=1 Tax=Caenispirillum salinarum AK4 TaxID=1238182 RepID=K9GVF4_9PROT|nr:hypothetical protein C882_0051 [Caenispirillum salinarum AK4]